MPDWFAMLCDKLPQTTGQTKTCLLSHSFYGSSAWARLICVLCKCVIKVPAKAQFSSGGLTGKQIDFQAPLGRWPDPFLMAPGPRTPAPTCCPQSTAKQTPPT